MKKIADLKASRSTKLKRLDVLEDLRTTEGREWSDEESNEYDRLFGEVESLNDEISREEKVEARRKQRAIDAVKEETPEQEVAKRFSFHRGLSRLLRGKRPDGVEAEMTQEAEKEWRDAGVSYSAEGLAVPSLMINIKGKNVINGAQLRDLTIGGSNAGAELVTEEWKGHIYGLSIDPKVVALGAQVITGLTGTPKFTKSGTVAIAWEGETDANASATPSTDEITMTPHRGGLKSILSKSLLAVTPGLAEEITRRELSQGMSVGLDAAAINGATPAPDGILAMSGVNDAPIGTNGGNLTRAHLLSMKQMIQEDNAVLSDMAWLGTPGIENFLMDLLVDAGSGRFVWNEDSNKVLGYMAHSSNNVPSTLTKGSSVGVCHALILGCWNQLMMGNWGGVDFVFDPITLADTNQLRIVMNSFWDIKARHEQAFCVTKDVTVT